MPHVTLNDAFAHAAELYRLGRLTEAASIYRQILTYQPDHAPALHMLGVVHAQNGELVEAEKFIRKAVAIDPAEPSYHANLGNVLQDLGKVEESVDSYRRALAINVGLAEVQSNLGNALQKLGRSEEAISAYRNAIRLRSEFPEAHFNLANALRERQKLEEAGKEYRLAIVMRPGYGEAYLNWGLALLSEGDAREAVRKFRRAAELLPNSNDALRNLGLALTRDGQFDEAIDRFAELTRRNPKSADAQHDVGNALREAGRLDEAAAAYRRAIALRPDFADSHYGLAWTLLMKGESDSGFAEYEWRGGLKEAVGQARHFAKPQWDGSRSADQKILLHAEQGFGDTIFAWRYVPMAIGRCGQTIVQCARPLQTLLGSQAVVAQVVADDREPPEFNLHCPLMSLPHVLGIGSPTAAAQSAYLSADESLVARWRELIGDHQARRQVGLVWAGKPTPPDRSIPLSMFAPLAQAADVRFHSLQVGLPARQTRPAALEMIDWSAQLTDFAQTAALIANLDLIITIDTAVAHLAGAMGKATWVLLQFVPDWRWSLGQDTTPWYPTVRLFRQPKPGDWTSVVAAVAEQLESKSAGQAPPCGTSVN